MRQPVLERRRIMTELISVDKQVHPYHDLREAIYENRIAFPRYTVRLRADDVEVTEIAVKELMELVDNGNKIDHPEGGSKDIADSMAGVAFNLMGDRSFHRRIFKQSVEPTEEKTESGILVQHPALVDARHLKAPIPPSTGTNLWQPRIR
jgi:hypothetical protein